MLYFAEYNNTLLCRTEFTEKGSFFAKKYKLPILKYRGRDILEWVVSKKNHKTKVNRNLWA